MEQNLNWYQISYEAEESGLPSKRWGHKTVYVQDEIVLFGGFSDVTYLNDLWAYNIHTNKWREIRTTGLRPEGKSNFTMHFDSVTNQLLIFGGGGPNKRRFNKISLLNWSTKEWTEVEHDSNDGMSFAQRFLDSQIPWQRTYHSSEFKYPYLITFGGEGAGNMDLEDLWVFDIETRKWAELRTGPSKTTQQNSGKAFAKIEGRKFHSTALVGEQFFVISGCKMNYSCIPNIYSVDLKGLFDLKRQGRSGDSLKEQADSIAKDSNDIGEMVFSWKLHEVEEKELGFIEKWGHSSEAYDGKIYIFGGRNQEDFNDLLQFDPKSNRIQKLNPCSSSQQKLPKSRRRHSSCMIGSSMVIFGGFNQDYFSDLQYISLFGCRDTLSKDRYVDEEGEEMIELESGMFCHFMQEMDKDRPEYDIEIFVESARKKGPVVVRSVSSVLAKASAYFRSSLMYSQSSNPERNNLTVSLESLGVSVLAFQIFNNFLIKDLLILPRGCSLKRLCELLICADYFQVASLFKLIQNILTIKAIDEKENLNDIFNIAASWNMHSLLKVCAQKKVRDQAYFNTYSRTIGLSYSAARLKDRYVEQVLMEIQFDEIQKGQKRRTKSRLQQFGRNIRQYNLVAEEKGLIEPSTSRRKKSFVEKFVEGFSKLCAMNSNEGEGKILEKRGMNVSLADLESDDDQMQGRNEIKMFEREKQSQRQENS